MKMDRTAWICALAGLLLLPIACGGGDSYNPGETTAALCADGADNDGDGQTDCYDSDCAGFIFCAPQREETAAACSDDADNDGDGDTDCQDTDCQGFVFCVQGTEEDREACQDGRDNDNDGDTDCGDAGCQGFLFCQGVSEDSEEQCQDSADNDDDGKTDCADPGCQGFDFCSGGGESSPADCQDGQDNDDDGATDCEDSGCQAYIFCQPEDETTAAACRDGEDNDDDGATDCTDTDCQGYTFCSSTPSGGESTQVECTDDRDNDRDGKTDCADEGCWAWGFCNHYHGFPLTDSWGETFDGIERTAASFAQAAQVCEDLGGRLPTITELYRNNASTGTGDLSDSRATSPLWTAIRCHLDTPTRVCVRLSDGHISYRADDTPTTFRCVWPDAEGDGFDEARCHGQPASACWTWGRYWNVDRLDRPAVDLVSAINECAFYGASIPLVGEWGELIHAGIPPDQNSYLWAADPIVVTGSLYLTQIMWDPGDEPHWHYAYPSWGTVADSSSSASFRCIGLSRPASYPPPTPTCQGDCLRLDARRSSLLADQEDRLADSVARAASTCRTEGGELARLIEVTELIHAGWTAARTGWEPSLDAVEWISTDFFFGVPVFTNPSGMDSSWSWREADTGSYTLTGDAYPFPFRCVWRSSGPALPDCQADEITRWNGASFFCVTSRDGTSNGNANQGIEYKDDWGNAWDGLERNAATFSAAETTCTDLGGRLPTASELWAVRNRPDPGDGSDPYFNPHGYAGNSTDTNPLWTTTHTSQPGQRALVQVAQGTSSQNAESASRHFRCIWPAERGDVLGGRNCYGPPGQECFTTDSGVVADTYDRVALDVAGAINDCASSGGHLPDLREITELVHSGWPNGTDGVCWTDEAIFHDALMTATYASYRWSGAGSSDWEYAGTGGDGILLPEDFIHFRCVYSERLR
ncbi:MAG: hypothetical protein JXR96_27325 [Deltaproteobacteria bacterium]|nr:hypothetical protein [Deltaproteobacteria bacterium]